MQQSLPLFKNYNRPKRSHPSSISQAQLLYRFEGDLIRYFKRFHNRTDVKFFVTDMNPHFKAVAKTCFPDAYIIADRYHVIRQVVWAMENVRKTEQKALSQKFRKYFKRSKYLLSKPLTKLTEKDMHHLSLMFEISPRLADAYRLKNYFLKSKLLKHVSFGLRNFERFRNRILLCSA